MHTPCHMPGHILLFIDDSKTLVAADAVVMENGGSEIANPAFMLDLQQALASLKKLQQLQAERLGCYHGGVLERNLPQQFGRLLARYRYCLIGISAAPGCIKKAQGTCAFFIRGKEFG